MSQNSNHKQTFEEITFIHGRGDKSIVYLVQGWTVPLQASKEYWIQKYNLDPTQAVVKKTTLKD